jgi:putative redox protein
MEKRVMQPNEGKRTRNYHLEVIRQDEDRVVAQARGHTLTLNARKGSGEAGLNAAETLMAALGTCLLTNMNALAQKMHLQIDAARVEIDAVRQDDPPLLTELRYQLIIDSPEDPDKLQDLHDLSIKWGTVTNTLINGITPHGELLLIHSGRDR